MSAPVDKLIQSIYGLARQAGVPAIVVIVREPHQVACPACQGSGRVVDGILKGKICPKCMGNRAVFHDRVAASAPAAMEMLKPIVVEKFKLIDPADEGDMPSWSERTGG